MQNPHSNHFQGPVQTLTRTIQTVDSNRNVNILPQRVPASKENYLIVGSPSPSQLNSNPFYERTLNDKPIGQDFQTYKVVTNDFQTKASMTSGEQNDFRKDFTSHKIDNKYGLQVRKIEKTPKNSYTDSDLKLGSQRSHPTYQKLNENNIKAEKRSIDCQNSQMAQLTINNSFRDLIYSQPSKVVYMSQTAMPILQSHSYQNIVIPKNDIKIEKEIVVKEFPDFKKESNQQSLQNQLRKTNELEKEITQKELIASKKEKNHAILINQIKQINQGNSEIIEIEIENIGNYEGGIHNNSLFGFGKLFNKKKQLVFEGEFVDNNFEGVGIQYNYSSNDMGTLVLAQGMTIPTNWIRFEGLFHENKKTGMGSLYFFDGSYFCGQFEEDQANGFGSLVNNNGDVIRGIWRDNTHVSR